MAREEKSRIRGHNTFLPSPRVNDRVWRPTFLTSPPRLPNMRPMSPPDGRFFSPNPRTRLLLDQDEWDRASGCGSEHCAHGTFSPRPESRRSYGSVASSRDAILGGPVRHAEGPAATVQGEEDVTRAEGEGAWKGSLRRLFSIGWYGGEVRSPLLVKQDQDVWRRRVA